MKNDLESGPEKGDFMLARSAERGANSYGIIRVIAAVLVIWTHSYSVVGGETAAEPLKELTRWSAGSHAVNIFFSLSGFMVAASWERSRNLFDFVIARILRIMPALVCVNVLIVVLTRSRRPNRDAAEPGRMMRHGIRRSARQPASPPPGTS